MKSNKPSWYEVKAFLVEAQNKLTRRVLLLGIHKTNESGLIRLGSYYGGWWVPVESLSHELESKVCISAGIGGDVTFDKALLEAGFQVIALDPLEQCIVFANESLAKFREFTALQIGLWNQSGTQTFFSPQNLDHDSWSATNSQNTSIPPQRILRSLPHKA